MGRKFSKYSAALYRLHHVSIMTRYDYSSLRSLTERLLVVFSTFWLAWHGWPWFE